MYSLLFHKNHSSSGLRSAVVLIAFNILSRRSVAGTCIRRQLTIHRVEVERGNCSLVRSDALGHVFRQVAYWALASSMELILVHD